MNFYFLKIVVVITSLLMFISCRHKGKDVETDIVYDLSNARPGSIEDVFSELEVTPLYFNGIGYPKNVMNVTVDDGYIFILDIKRILHIFSSDGRYLSNSSKKIGQGPGEYSVLMGFSWNPYSKLIEILTPDRILFYDVDFNFIRSCDAPSDISKGVIFGYIGDLSATEHVLLPTGISKNPDRIMFYDSLSEKITNESSYAKDVIAPTSMSSQFLFHEGDSTRFCPPSMTKYVYRISDNLLGDPFMELRYGKNVISRRDVEEHNGSEEELRNYLVTCSKDIPMANFFTSKKIFTILKHGNKLEDTYVVAIERNGGKAISINLKNKDKTTFPIIYDVDSCFVYSIVSKSILLNSPNLTLNEENCITDKIKEIDEEDFVLLKYTVSK